MHKNRIPRQNAGSSALLAKLLEDGDRRLIEEDLIFEPDKRRISLYEGIIQSKGISEAILTRLVSGTISPTGYELTLGDLNDSGGLDAGDLVLMLQRVLPLPE